MATMLEEIGLTPLLFDALDLRLTRREAMELVERLIKITEMMALKRGQDIEQHRASRGGGTGGGDQYVRRPSKAERRLLGG